MGYNTSLRWHVSCVLIVQRLFVHVDMDPDGPRVMSRHCGNHGQDKGEAIERLFPF